MDALTIPEAASAVGLSPREVRVRIEEGDLRAFTRAGQRMVERAELERIMPPEPPPLREVPPPSPSTRAVEDLAARLEEQAAELAELRRQLSRAHDQIADLQEANARPALSELFQSTDPKPS